MYKLMNVLNNVMMIMHNQNQDIHVVILANIIQKKMDIDIVINNVMEHIHSLLIQEMQINVQAIVLKQNLLNLQKDILVLNSVQDNMLNQLIAKIILVVLLVTIINLIKHLNNV